MASTLLAVRITRCSPISRQAPTHNRVLWEECGGTITGQDSGHLWRGEVEELMETGRFSRIGADGAAYNYVVEARA